tara:strand:+ start:6987 stop:7223 length:237 start_codon:yes stop_codon:yes gene_type:complete
MKKNQNKAPFGDKLRTARKELGRTQNQAAEALDVSPRTYWEWEKHKTKPYLITQEGAMARLNHDLAKALSVVQGGADE